MLRLYYHFGIVLMRGFLDLSIQPSMMSVLCFTVWTFYHCRDKIQMTSASEKEVIVFSVVEEMYSPFGTTQTAHNYRALWCCMICGSEESQKESSEIHYNNILSSVYIENYIITYSTRSHKLAMYLCKCQEMYAVS